MRAHRRDSPVAAALVPVLLTALLLWGGVEGKKSKMRVLACERGYQPFIYADTGQGFKGFEIDMWESVFMLLKLEVLRSRDEYLIDLVGEELPDIIPVPPGNGTWDEMIHWAAGPEGRGDLLFCGYYLQAYRARWVDFSMPTMSSGYTMVVSAKPRPIDGATLLASTVQTPEPQAAFAILILLIMSVIYAHIIWIVERHDNVMIREWYGPGLFDSWWLGFVTATTVGYGDKAPVTYLGRVVTVIWMLAGMYSVGLFSASLTTGLVADNLADDVGFQSDINQHSDMIGRKLGSYFGLAGPAAKAVEPLVDEVVIYGSQKEAYDALLAGDLDIVVDDKIGAEFFISGPPYRGNVTLTGPLWQPEDYAYIVMRPNETEHPLLPHLYRANLEFFRGLLRDDSQEIVQTWFEVPVDSSSVAATVLATSLAQLNTVIAVILSVIAIAWGGSTAWHHRELLVKSRERDSLMQALECTSRFDRYQAKKGAAKLFEQWDKNHDELLDLDEIVAALKEHGFAKTKDLDLLVLKEAAKSGINVPNIMSEFRCNQHQFQTLMSRVLIEGFESEAVATLDEPAQKSQVMQVLDEFRVKGDILDYKINRIEWMLRGGAENDEIPKPHEWGQEPTKMYKVSRTRSFVTRAEETP